MTISSKISYSNALLLAISILLTTALIMGAMYHDLRKQALLAQESRIKTLRELLDQKGKDFQVADGKLKVGDYIINDNFELPDKLKELCGGTATIFLGDTRVSTNVLKPDGSRAIGTKLQGPAYDAIFKEGKPYRGEADILGTPYFTAYDPIKNGHGDIIAGEISSNILQITHVVVETAKGAQETASASSRLAQLAEELKALTGRFKLAA